MKIKSKITGMEFADTWMHTKSVDDLIGECVMLIHEDDNEYDHNRSAVAVYLDGYKLGYIKARKENFDYEENVFYKNCLDKIEYCKIVDVFKKTIVFDDVYQPAEGEFISDGYLWNKKNGDVASITVETKVDIDEDPGRYGNGMNSVTEDLDILPLPPETQRRFDEWKFNLLRKAIVEKNYDKDYCIDNGYQVYREYLNELATAGTIRHSDIEEMIGIYQNKGVSELPDGPVRTFLERSAPTVVATEKRLLDEQLGRNGTADFVCTIMDVPVVIDWKTGTIKKKHLLQAAFYAHNLGCSEAWIVSFKTKNKCGYTVSKIYKKDHAKEIGKECKAYIEDYYELYCRWVKFLEMFYIIK